MLRWYRVHRSRSPNKLIVDEATGDDNSGELVPRKLAGWLCRRHFEHRTSREPPR